MSMQLRSLFRIIVKLTIVVAMLWVAALGFLYFRQEAMIFPSPSVAMASARGSAFQTVVVETPDGISLNMLHHPAKPGEASVILLHGNGGSLTAMLPTAAIYEKASFGVLIASYRGYSGNPGHPSMGGLYTDGLAAFDWLQEMSEDRIFLHAHSLGAAVAIHIVENRNGDGVALLSPFDSLLAVAEARYPIFPIRPLLRHPFPSIDKITNVSEPIMIYHGTADQVVPIMHGEALHRAAPPGTGFEPIPGASHNNLAVYGVTEKAIDFFQSLQ